MQQRKEVTLRADAEERVHVRRGDLGGKTGVVFQESKAPWGVIFLSLCWKGRFFLEYFCFGFFKSLKSLCSFCFFDIWDETFEAFFPRT